MRSRVGMPTMEPVCAMVAMGRERFAWALYHSGEVENDIYLPKRLTSFQVNNMAEILIQLNPPIMFVGELDARARRDIRQAWEEDWADLISPALSVRRGAVLAELGWLRIQKGQTDDPDTLNAIYIK